jgi:hypothetical protein
LINERLFLTPVVLALVTLTPNKFNKVEQSMTSPEVAFEPSRGNTTPAKVRFAGVAVPPVVLVQAVRICEIERGVIVDAVEFCPATVTLPVGEGGSTVVVVVTTTTAAGVDAPEVEVVDVALTADDGSTVVNSVTMTTGAATAAAVGPAS